MAARSKRKPASAAEQPSVHKKPRKTSALGPIPWAANSHTLAYQLLCEVEKSENFKVLFGKKDKHENTSGETKISVYKRIGSVLLPEMFMMEPTTVADRVKAKMESLIEDYKFHAKRLRVTGGGIDADDDSQQLVSNNPVECMDFYIPASGPEESTPDFAVNLWQQIESDFPLFPRLHAMLATRPNVNPPVIATGVGPQGRKIVYTQPPDGMSIEDVAGDSSQSSGVFDETPQMAPQVQHQYRTLLEAMAATQATQSFTQEDIPVTAPRMEPDADKENTIPPSTPQNSSVSSYAKALIDKAKSNVKKLPPKPTLEETLIKLSTDNLAVIQTMKQEKLNLQKRQQYMEEFKLGLLSVAEYREAVAKLEKVEQPPRDRSGSPDWEGGDELPMNVPDL